MMAVFKIFCLLPIVCLTLTKGWSHRSLGRVENTNNFQCPSEGFHPDPNDCHIFYRCVDWNSNVFFRDYNEPSFTSFKFSCGEGTVFDPDFNICNHPSQTSRKDCKRLVGNGGNEEDMTNNQYPFTYPSVTSGGENYPTEGGYPGYPMKEITNYPNMNENQISPDGEVMESSPGDCPGEGFFPVVGDCNRFMRCTDDGMGGFRKYVFRCGEGTVWDQQNLVCNHPDTVPGCGSNQQSGGQYPNQGGYPENGNPMEYPQMGYPGDNPQGTIPDESGYPQEYYPQQGSYPGGIQQNQNVHPAMQGNQGGYPESNIPQTDNHGYPQEQGNKPNQSGYQPQQGYPELSNQKYPMPGNRPPVQNQGYPQQQGNRPPTNKQTLGYSPNQSPYGPQGYPGQQNLGSYTTPESTTQNQGYPEQESNRPSENQQNQGNQPNPSGYPSQGTYPGQSVPQNRPENQGYPQQGGYPNQGYPLEGSPEDSSDRAPMNDSKNCQSDGFFSVPGDCTKFYRCVDNGKGSYFRFDFTCGPNTVWDQEQTTCNHPWAVQRNDCSNSMMNSPSPDMQNQIPSQNTPSIPQQQPSNQNQISTTTAPSSQFPPNQMSTPNQQLPSQTTPSQQETTEGPENQITQMETQSTTEGSQSGNTTPNNQPDMPNGSRPCQPDKNQPIKCEKAGYYPVPGNCKKFYRCVDWDGDKNERFSVYYYECGEGTIWDPALQTCNHEESVYPQRDCSGGQNEQAISTTISPTTAENGVMESITSTTPREMDTTPQNESTGSVESIPQSTESMTTMEMTTENEETTSEQADKTTELTNNKPTEPTDDNTTEQNNKNPTEPNENTTLEEDKNNQTEPSDSNTTEEDKNNPTEPGDNSTTEQSNSKPTEETTDEDSNQTKQPESGENNSDCPELEEGQTAFVCPTGFRRHPRDCNLFYQCTISKSGDINVMTFMCKNDSIYDERKIQCLPPDETDPCPNKQNIRKRFTRKVEPEMTSVVPIASSESLCPREGYFPYDGDCQMFFKCKRDYKGRMQGYLYQCQKKHFFSPKTGHCESSSSTITNCFRSIQYLTQTNLKWMTSKVPIEYFDVR